MTSTVDFIGVDAVSKIIDQSKFCKFVILREGDARGAVCVFRSDETTNPSKCKEAFRGWANTSIATNPYNTQAYQMRLYKGDPEDPENPEKSIKRSDIMVFTFCLVPSAYNGIQSQVPGAVSGTSETDIQAIVDRALKEANDKRVHEDLIQELKGIKEELAEQKAAKEAKPEPEPEDESGDIGSSFKRVLDILREIREIKREKAAYAAADEGDDKDDFGIPKVDAEDVEFEEVAGDDEPEEEDDDLDEEEENEEEEEEMEEEEEEEGMEEEEEEEEMEEEEKSRTTDVEKRDATEVEKKVGKALKILAKNDPRLAAHLIKLAKMSEKMPKMFKQVMGQLDDL